MNKQLNLAFFSLAFCFTMLTSLMAQMNTPLIDREILFGNPEISGGELSPDGKQISFMKEHKGIMNIWVKDIDAPFEDAKLLTNSSSPILGFFWTYDSKYILYVNDKGGDENLNIFAVDPQAEIDGEVPPSRNLTPKEDVTAQIYQVSKKNPDKLMIGLNDRDKAWHDLYELTISTGELKLLFENTDRFTGWDFDWDENLRLAYRTDDNGFSQILRVDEGNKFEKIYGTNLQESAYVAGWTPDNSKAYLVSNKGEVNFSTLFEMDPQDGSVTAIESDPKEKVDFGGMFIDDNTREIIYTSYIYDKRERLWKNKDWEEMYAYLKAQFPNREVGFTSMTKDYNKFLLSVSGDKYASQVFFYDRETKELIHQYTPRPKLKEYEDYLAEMKSISYASSDGLEIPAYLTLPVGQEAKNLPTVILVHGGPKGPRDYWGFDSYAQLLANRGYAVLQPNFRASGGFGKSFLNAGDREWGKLMQDDITWGVKYLIEQGIADADKVAIMGGSYGGYATLAGLAFTPDLYACGIDIVGPSNLFTLLETIPPYWEAGRKWLYEMVGDPETEEGKKLLTEASPLFSVDKIEAPLLIVQGANDPRVKKAESDQIVIALRDNGHQVEYLLAEDEGHGFRKPLNRKAMWAEAEKFLAQQIGGRYQEDMPDDVRATLENLRVDIESVTYSTLEVPEVTQEMPSINNAFTQGESDYSVVLELQGQKIPMELKETVQKEGDNWVVRHALASPMGESINEVVYDENYHVVNRTIEQAGQKITAKFGDKTVEVQAMGQTKSLDADGLVLSDGPGFGALLANGVISAGEKKSFYIVDPMTLKLKQVVAERVEKGGTVKIVVVSVDNESEKTTFWIEDGSVTKQERVLPAMQNAVMTMTRLSE